MLLDFFSGIQKKQFADARETLIIYDNNKDYTDKTTELVSVVDELVSILTSKEPYSDIYKLPTLRKNLIDILMSMYEAKAEPIIKRINETIKYFENEAKNAEVDESFATKYIDTCKSVINTLNTSNELKDIYAQQTRVDQLK